MLGPTSYWKDVGGHREAQAFDCFRPELFYSKERCVLELVIQLMYGFVCLGLCILYCI